MFKVKGIGAEPDRVYHAEVISGIGSDYLGVYENGTDHPPIVRWPGLQTKDLVVFDDAQVGDLDQLRELGYEFTVGPAPRTEAVGA